VNGAVSVEIPGAASVSAPVTVLDEALVSVCGRVRAVPPAPGSRDPYWRLGFLQNGQRHQPRGGKTRDSALAKMADILARLDAGTDARREMRVEVLLDEWLGPDAWRRDGRPWSQGHLLGTTFYVEKHLRPTLGKLRAKELSKAQYTRALNSAPTAQEAKQVRKRLGSFLTWAHRTDALSAAQRLELAATIYSPAGGVRAGRPSRRSLVRTSGEDGTYLSEHDRMDYDLLARLGAGLQAVYANGELYAELGASTGCRQGELFALTIDELSLDERVMSIRWQVASKGVKRLERPKGGKIRRTVLPAKGTGTGFDLLGALKARAASVIKEREAGRNPRGLLLPAPRGGWWSASNFDTRVWAPGASAAGVPLLQSPRLDADGRPVMGRDGEPVVDSAWRYTSHSLRDRYAITALDDWKWTPGELAVAGGWENSDVIFRRYYGAAGGALASMHAKTA
jgi:integrase